MSCVRDVPPSLLTRWSTWSLHAREILYQHYASGEHASM